MKYYILGTDQEIDIVGWAIDTSGLLVAYAIDVYSGETIYVHESRIEKR